MESGILITKTIPNKYVLANILSYAFKHSFICAIFRSIRVNGKEVLSNAEIEQLVKMYSYSQSRYVSEVQFSMVYGYLSNSLPYFSVSCIYETKYKEIMEEASLYETIFEHGMYTIAGSQFVGRIKENTYKIIYKNFSTLTIALGKFDEKYASISATYTLKGNGCVDIEFVIRLLITDINPKAPPELFN